MIYENEELRLRTININAEVEQGRSDIRKLRRENEQLKREIWNLRDEYDRINKKGCDEGICDNCLHKDSESDIDDNESFRIGKFGPPTPQNDQPYENYTHETLPEKSKDLRFSLSLDELPLNTEVFENHENMSILMKDPVALRPPALNYSDKNYQISNRDVYPHYTGQLSVLSEENLTSSDCISCINENSDNFQTHRCPKKPSNSGEIILQPTDPLISTNDSNDNMKTKRKFQLGYVESIESENEMHLLETKNRHVQGKNIISTVVHCPVNFFSTLHQCSNEKFESAPYFKNPPDLFVSNALASPYHRLESAVESNTSCRLHQKTEIISLLFGLKEIIFRYYSYALSDVGWKEAIRDSHIETSRPFRLLIL